MGRKKAGPPASTGPLFILAPPRSFTSVICGMIGQHPAMYALPEVNLLSADTLAGLKRLYSLRPGFRHGLLRTVAELGLGGQTVENIQAAKDWLDEHAELTTAEVYRDLADWAAPRRLVDKSPIYVYVEGSFDRMLQAFPDASFLHLTRHPRPTCESIYKLRDKVKDGMQRMGFANRQRNNAAYEKLASIDDPESLWLQPNQRIMAFMEKLPEARRLRIRGEDFMTDPDTHLTRVAEWLGISADDGALGSMKHPEASPYARYGPLNARFGNDPSYLESPALRPYTPKTYSMEGPLEGTADTRLSQAIRDLAAEFGYT